MKIVLTETQILKLLERVNSGKVTCDKCDWSWKLSDGGDDPYICHKCGHNNSDEDYIGKNVMVYYNLHKHTFSVTYKSKVILHADYVKLKDVEFRVRGGGKEKVRNEKRKNVHAFVIGKLEDYCEFPCNKMPDEKSDKIITYDPYKYDSFVYKDSKEPVHKAKEVDMINHKNKIFVINEIKSKIIKESEEDLPTKYTYLTMGLFEKFNTKRYYFNKIVPVIDDSPIPNKIKMYGSDGDFEFNKEDITINQDKGVAFINKSTMDSLNPNFSITNHSKLSSSIGITPSNIRQSLEMAFPDNWNKGDSLYTPGLKGIYTIGEKTGDPEEDWSIMNYFDTKDEIHSLIYLKYFDDVKSGKIIEDIIEWMSDLFKNEDYSQMLVDRQWSSIKSGLGLERMSVNNFLDKVGSSNVTYYPHGSKMDRWLGVDVTIDGVNYQIKPLKGFTVDNGLYSVSTYGMRDYTSKKSVDKIAFSSKSKILIFDNKDYTVISKTRVVFK